MQCQTHKNEGGMEATWHNPKKALESRTPLILDREYVFFT